MLTVATLLAAAVLPGSATAQQPGAADASPGWPAPAFGVRLGFEQGASGQVLGGQLRIPILRNSHVEIVPNGDVTFLSRLREYGFNVDAVYVTGGRQGGIYLGGALGWRNSIFTADVAGARETRTGFGAVVGVKGGGPVGLETQVEFRWTVLPDTSYNPRSLTLGLNFPFWGRTGVSGSR